MLRQLIDSIKGAQEMNRRTIEAQENQVKILDKLAEKAPSEIFEKSTSMQCS